MLVTRVVEPAVSRSYLTTLGLVLGVLHDYSTEHVEILLGFFAPWR